MVHAAPPARFAAAGSRLLPPVYDLAQEVADLPRDLEPWPCAADPARSPRIAACLERARAHGGWRWPERPLVFVSDTHADADGFLRSLVGAGVIRRRAHGPPRLVDEPDSLRWHVPSATLLFVIPPRRAWLADAWEPRMATARKVAGMPKVGGVRPESL